jgi:hypothetical protein
LIKKKKGIVFLYEEERIKEKKKNIAWEKQYYDVPATDNLMKNISDTLSFDKIAKAALTF